MKRDDIDTAKAALAKGNRIEFRGLGFGATPKDWTTYGEPYTFSPLYEYRDAGKIPKLADLTQEHRRVLCAEALGWKYEHSENYDAFHRPDGNYAGGATHDLQRAMANADVPNPDESHADAFALVDWLREHKGLGFILSDDPWECRFINRFDEFGAMEDTAPKAITSAFLLATGAAQ